MLSLKRAKRTLAEKVSVPLESKHRYIELFNGDSEIPVFDISNYSEISGDEISGHFWFSIDDLMLRSDNLRPAHKLSKDCGEPMEGVPTGSVHKIADNYRKDWSFNSFPILCHVEGGKLVVYEGRHRTVGAVLAKRSYILGMLVGPEYPNVLDQNDPANEKYYGKPLYSAAELAEIYRDNPYV